MDASLEFLDESEFPWASKCIKVGSFLMSLYAQNSSTCRKHTHTKSMLKEWSCREKSGLKTEHSQEKEKNSPI